MKLAKKVKPMKKSKGSIKKSTMKKKKELDKVTTDEFFEQNFDQASDTEISDEDQPEENLDSGSEESDLDPDRHKKSLNKLKDTDPEFYSFLQQTDKSLLDFDVSDQEEEEQEEEEGKHVPDGSLEVASDESDFEAEEDEKSSGGPTKVTLQLLKTWQEEIQTDRTSKTIKTVVEAFHAALLTLAESDEAKHSLYRVEGSAVFNGVVQLCVLQLPAAFKRFLRLGSETRFEAHKAKRFVKIKGVLHSYLKDLIQVLQNVSSANILTVLLKHLHQMLPFTQSFSTLNKPLLRILIKLWSTGEETVRVVAFINILFIATSHRESILETLLKTMYVKYVENAKFVSPNSMPGINFMRHSLVEIYLLDYNLSYNHAFLYIRQLAIHLRNAMTLKRKENFQAVYNWQYINSLRFWEEVITSSKSQSMLRTLLYPLVQIIIGTLKLVPTIQFYPLRFHCVQMLINISKETGTFIPVLPFLLEILSSYDFSKKHKAVSMKPVLLHCILRASKAQSQENGYKDSIIETIYQLILENAAKDSHTVYFPDLYVPAVVQLKAFLKKCNVANYCRKMKQLLDKIEENRKFIENQRAKVTLDLANMMEIKNFENRIKTEGTNLVKFYESWKKIQQSRKMKLITKNDEISEFHLPTIKKSKKKKLDDEEEEFDDGESSDGSDFLLPIEKAGNSEEKPSKTKKPKKRKLDKGKKSEKEENEGDDMIEENRESVDKGDIVQDIKDWD